MAAAKKNSATEAEANEASTTTRHNPCTVAGGKVRLAAIASIAEPAKRVSQAFAQQAEDEYAICEAAAADDAKDARTVRTAYRWVEAARAASESESR